MTDRISSREKWNRIYSAGSDRVQYAPIELLRDYAHLLPERGTALDLACGLGANAMFLAARGLETCAWDISPVAIEKLRRAAAGQGIDIHAEVRDVETVPFEKERFDVIVIGRFLVRRLAGAIVKALKPNGLLFYQTFIAEKVDDCGPSNPTFLLRENELLDLFRELRIVFYREEGLLGDHSRGLRNQAQLIGERRPQSIEAEKP